MKHLLWNLLLGGVWMSMTGDFSVGNLLVGLVLGYIVISLADAERLPGPYARAVGRVLRFAGFYVWELVVSSLRVAHDVLTPRMRARPAFLTIPLDPAHSDASATLLANLITMTPGTMSLGISQDRRFLYIHAMFGDDPQALERSIKDDFERRILELMP